MVGRERERGDDSRSRSRDRLSLATAVRSFAECPCPEHEADLRDALRRHDQQIALELAAPGAERSDRDAALPMRRHGAQLLVSIIEADGQRMAVACSYLDEAKHVRPDAYDWLSLDVSDAARMVLASDLDGLAVFVADDDLFAGLTREGLADLAGGARGRWERAKAWWAGHPDKRFFVFALAGIVLLVVIVVLAVLGVIGHEHGSSNFDVPESP